MKEFNDSDGAFVIQSSLGRIGQMLVLLLRIGMNVANTKAPFYVTRFLFISASIVEFINNKSK